MVCFEIFSKYAVLNPTEIGRTDLVQCHIDTGDNPSVSQPPQRIPFAIRPKVKEMIREMLEQQVMQES